MNSLVMRAKRLLKTHSKEYVIDKMNKEKEGRTTEET